MGNNDALVPALTGQLEQLTPLSTFTSGYNQVISALAGTKAALITANVPDVTKIPFFMPVAALAQEAGLPIATVTSVLGVGSDDYIRNTGVPIALGLLQGQAPPAPYSWPASCPLPSPGLLPPGIPLPCVFSAADATKVQSVVASYNKVIVQQSAQFGAKLVDINSYLTQVANQGLKGRRLLFEYDVSWGNLLTGRHSPHEHRLRAHCQSVYRFHERVVGS